MPAFICVCSGEWGGGFPGRFQGGSGGGEGGWARARRKTKANDQAIPKTNENKLCAVMQVQWS